MVNRINISIGLTADIQEFIKSLQGQLGNIKTTGLDKAFEKDIDNISDMLKGLAKSISDLGSGKVNTSTFAKAQKDILDRVQALETRTTTLEGNMSSLISTMSKMDGGKFAKEWQEIANGMQTVNTIAVNTVSAIDAVVNSASNADTTSLKELLDSLNGIIDLANKDYSVDIKFDKFKDARDYLIKTYNHIQTLKKEASEIIPNTNDDVKRLSDIQRQMVELIRTFQEVYDKQFDGDFADQFEEFRTKGGQSFDDLEEITDRIMQSILNNVKTNVSKVKAELESIGDVDITNLPNTVDVKREKDGLSVPLNISTKSST